MSRYIEGFTLTEFLVALAILGTIGTFTIPKVLQAQENEKNKAVLRETIAAMSAITYEGVTTGALANASVADVTQFYLDRLNYIKFCSAAQADGCYYRTTYETKQSVALASGATAFDFTPGAVAASRAITMYIDANGNKLPNLGVTLTEKFDSVRINCSIGTQNYVDDGISIRPGKCDGSSLTRDTWETTFR